MLWTKRIVLAFGVLLLAFVFGWVPYWLGGIATTRRFQFNDKENAGLTPASFQLPYEDVAFKAPDGVRASRLVGPGGGAPRAPSSSSTA